MTGLVIITGANGFIGHVLAARWTRLGRPYRGLVRVLDASRDLARASDGALADALAGASAVVHLAGRAHVMNETVDAQARFREANVVATERLARAAIRARIE